MINHGAKFLSTCITRKQLTTSKIQWWDRHQISYDGVSHSKGEKMVERKESLLPSNFKIQKVKFH